MIILSFNNLKNLNVSLQVGDGVYARNTITQVGADDPQGANIDPGTGLLLTETGKNHYVGILKNIDDLGNNQYDLHVDDDPTASPFSVNNPYLGSYYSPGVSDFIMFSKFEQGDSGVLGYYAEAKFVNDSREKAELFAISSEVIINSK